MKTFLQPGQIGLGGKGFFGPGGVPPNIQVFGAAGGNWNKPAPPAGKRIVGFQFLVIGAGGGASSGNANQNGATGIPATPVTGGGGGGGFCLYTPAIALVPAVIAIVGATGGPGGAQVTVVGSFAGNAIAANPGTAGSGPTTLAGGVVQCNAGGANSAGNAPGGTGNCTLAWGGSAITATGGRGSHNGRVIVDNPPTLADLLLFTNSAGETTARGPGGGGGPAEFSNGLVNQYAGCYGGGPNSPGAAPGGDIYITVGGASQNTNNGGDGGFLQGGGSAGNYLLNLGVGPGPANAWIMGRGGNGGPGGGGGVGGCWTIFNFANAGSVTVGAGGAGGNSFVQMLTLFG